MSFVTTEPPLQNNLIPHTLTGRGREVLKPGCLPLLSAPTTSEQCQLWASVSMFLYVVIVTASWESGAVHRKHIDKFWGTVKRWELPAIIAISITGHQHHPHHHLLFLFLLFSSPLPPGPLRKTLTSLLMKTQSGQLPRGRRHTTPQGMLPYCQQQAPVIGGSALWLFFPWHMKMTTLT